MTLPLALNRVSTDAALAGSLGDTVKVGDKAYRLVKAAANISSAASQLVSTAFSSGVPTYAVNTTSTSGDKDIVGVIPSDIVTISSTASQIDSGSYFWVQFAGPATVLASLTTITDGATLRAATVAGQVAAITAADNGALVGVATNTAAATAAGLGITAVLKGIV